jgi:hypothetical protein
MGLQVQQLDDFISCHPNPFSPQRHPAFHDLKTNRAG